MNALGCKNEYVGHNPRLHGCEPPVHDGPSVTARAGACSLAWRTLPLRAVGLRARTAATCVARRTERLRQDDVAANSRGPRVADRRQRQLERSRRERACDGAA